MDEGWTLRDLVLRKGGRERVVFFDDACLATVQTYLATRRDNYLLLFLRDEPARGRPGPNGEHWWLARDDQADLRSLGDQPLKQAFDC